MPFHVIRGTFHVKGYSPDGDSIRFHANNVSNWGLLSGPPAKRNGKDHVQLRLEAIDTLETHFQGFHQPLEFAQKAMDHLMALLGITGVVWYSAGTKVEQANDGTAGYILAREVEKNGRPVAFAFSGTPPEMDGTSVFLDANRVEQSANAEMLRSGLAYPTYYKGLFPELRKALTQIVAAARQGQKGVWPKDKTIAGFAVAGLASVTDDHVILPKLFRRLAEYLEGGGPVSGFKDFLEALSEEILIISTAHSTHFDNIVAVAGNVVKMTEPPENVMFLG
jgi:endonuclease YncB( thermonuclease family)